MKIHLVLLVVALGFAMPLSGADASKKIVLIAGKLDPGHGRGTHEYEKAAQLLQQCIDTSPNLKGMKTEVHLNGWPQNSATLDDADTIVVISNGSDRKEEEHPLLLENRLQILEKHMTRGCGLVIIHWTVFVPKEKAGGKYLDWIGGFFDYESGADHPKRWFSRIKTVTTTAKPGTPGHPVCRGLQPFEMQEEWYYNIRFKENDARLAPILVTPIPGESKEQTVAWAVERADGGRGFGTTGGHFFRNYSTEGFRKMLLNAIVWTARAEVPADGVQSIIK